MERHWSAVQEWLGELLLERGVDRITAEELTVPPGMDELFSLLVLKRHHEAGEWDVIVVDCAPTGETLRLLSFPDVARWWLDKVFPRRAPDPGRGAADRALAARHPPAERGGVRRRAAAVRNLIAMNEILRDRERCTIRLVMNPDKMVIGEAMRTFTYLNLYGYLTDAVIVNRVFPDDVGDVLRRLARAPAASTWSSVESAFAPVPVLRAPYFEQEVVGPEMLDRLGEALFGRARPGGAVLHDALTQELSSAPTARLRLDLPFASKGDISLKKIGLELVVRVDGQKRTIMLPPALADSGPTAARSTTARSR